MEFIDIDSEGAMTVFDLSIPQPSGQDRKDGVAARESREARATRNLFSLLEARRELRGVYAPADQLAETLRWSA
jgi:hypothetical protein